MRLSPRWPPGCVSLSCAGASFRADVHLVNVGFSVRDGAGHLVPNLPQDDFEVFEDGTPQKIAFFAHSADVPLDLGLIVDFSGSQAEFIKAHHKDLDTFLKKALSSRDRVFLVCFGNRVRLAQDLHGRAKRRRSTPSTTSKSRAAAVFPNLRRASAASWERHSTTPSSIRSSKRLAASAGARKALIVFSDGEDNSSGHHMLEAIEAAQTNDVLLFPSATPKS